MASFAGADFDERGENAQFYPTWAREAEHTLTRTGVIQVSGVSTDTLALTIRCTASQLSALRGKVGSVGSLVFSGGTRSAFLKDISNPREILASGKYFATLNFIGR